MTVAHLVRIPLAFVILTVPVFANDKDRLTSWPRPVAAQLKPIPVGEEVRTGSSERRRVVLPDGSALFLNQNTTLKVMAARRLKLTQGEILVEAVASKEPFVVETAKREVTALGTTFAVSVAEAGTGVLVARGKVKVNDVETPLLAGQRVGAGEAKPQAAKRVAYELDWTRELMITAESPLVPASAHQGGSLTVVDPDGQSAKLSLRKYHVDVHVEDGFARTTIDQTYFNHTPSRLEGTFHFPLPADASLSRLAMYVEGTRMEGGMVERDYGRNVYESIVTKQQDPALLEWVDGTTFKMRVFPLEPRQEKRIVLSYAQRLDDHYGQSTYRFPAGHSLDRVRDWSLSLRLKKGDALSWSCPSHRLSERRDGDDRLLEATAKDAKLDRDVVLQLSTGAKAEPTRFALMEQDGARYLMVRHRPDFERQDVAAPSPRDWVFLFESSGDRDPLLARAQIEIIRGLLQSAGPDDRFAVLSAGTRVRSPMKELQPVTPSNLDMALTFLEGSHLIGALNLDAALVESAALLKDARNAHLVHVGSGIPAMGEQRRDLLLNRIPKDVTYVGVGVGRRWNRALMMAAAEKTGGYVTQVNPDESLSWRAFELASTLNAPRLLDINVSDDSGKNRWLLSSTQAVHGEEVCAIARLESREIPETIRMSAGINKSPIELQLRVGNLTKDAAYLPRAWARLEIDRLLAADAVKHKKDIVTLSKSMYVMSPFTSLLVLENESMYQQYKVDRGRKDHWALYDCPEKIDVFREDEDGNRIDPKKDAKPTVKQVLDTLHVVTNQAIEEEREYRRLVQVRLRERAGGSDEDLVVRKPPLPSRVTGIPPTTVLERAQVLRDVATRGFLDVDGSISRSGPGDFRTTILSPIRPPAKAFTSDLDAPPVPPTTILDPSTPKPTVDDFVYYGNHDFMMERNEHRYPLVRVGQIFIVGNTTTKQNVILRQIPLSLDSSLNLPAFRSSERNLARLNLFEGENAKQDLSGVFFDVVTYAPGMNTSLADVLAVLEAEADPERNDKQGKIDAEARKLFTTAKGWRTYTLPAKDGETPVRVHFDEQGRYAYERTLFPGFRERVVCDGTTLWHLYPDLHIGAKRPVSRFHRLAFAQAVPMALPRPEDLARGADLIHVGERTVALVPHGKAETSTRLHYVFDEQGNLIEQQLVSMPSKKVLSKQSFKASSKATAAPDLEPVVKDLVVLTLPHRSPEHVVHTRKLKDRRHEDLPFDDALALFGAEFARGNTEGLTKLFRESFHGRDQRQLGFYVLLAAAGANLDAQNLDVLSEHRDEPLAQYLALHTSPVLRKHASQWATNAVQWGEGALRHLAVTHALLQRWQSEHVLSGGTKRRQEAINAATDYAKKHPHSEFGFALLTLMSERAAEAERAGKDAKEVRVALADLWRHFLKTPGLEGAARYEECRAYLKANRRDEAKTAFLALFESARKEGGLPRIDEDFRAALGDDWNGLMRKTARELIDKERRIGVLVLARQCHSIGDEALALDLLHVALEGIKERKERLALTVAVVSYLVENGKGIEAERLLQPLLDDKEWATKAPLWRLAARLSEKLDRKARALECLERALDAEYRDRPEVMSVKDIANEYGELLQHYQRLSEAMVTLKVKPPEDFVAKVVRAADRWRGFDADNSEPCNLAARILRQLDESELAWDYQTTPVGRRPGESSSWVNLATSLRHQGDLKRADEAYASAFAAEPTNAQILWDRAQNLRQTGNVVESKKLLRQLVEGNWQSRFQPLQSQARWQLEQR